MKWTLTGQVWYAEDGTQGPPPGLPATNPTTHKPWKSGDLFDDAPPAPARVAPYTVGWHDSIYALPHPNSANFSIIIDSHQKKHTPSWPGNYPGGAGTTFPSGWTANDVIACATALVPLIPQLATTPAATVTLNNVTLANAYVPSKQTKVPNVIVNSPAWDAKAGFWSIHLYPAS